MFKISEYYILTPFEKVSSSKFNKHSQVQNIMPQTKLTNWPNLIIPLVGETFTKTWSPT